MKRQKPYGKNLAISEGVGGPKKDTKNFELETV